MHDTCLKVHQPVRSMLFSCIAGIASFIWIVGLLGVVGLLEMVGFLGWFRPLGMGWASVFVGLVAHLLFHLSHPAEMVCESTMFERTLHHSPSGLQVLNPFAHTAPRLNASAPVLLHVRLCLGVSVISIWSAACFPEQADYGHIAFYASEGKLEKKPVTQPSNTGAMRCTNTNGSRGLQHYLRTSMVKVTRDQ